ncbi:alpha-ketoacid dehydrogenase subunit beta [Hyalangium sp.]|uniref:alpha-ketoacid dehydrogenase subunit beta n=1 Tax=Hyalangium sp. TaxID=2028555 RepID=UPI002D66BC49|nr:transketolase C-terminal domain-containing protein [Hyalangium sp.]HYH97301.1 transketolase C-terminal domain-containing protein [Hyalangium sp.]
MKTLTMLQAIEEAIFEEMARDPRVLTFGEGATVKWSQLRQAYGPKRVRTTPLSEGIIAGTAVGASAMGLRPVVDLLYAPFLTYAMEPLINSAGKQRYMSGGQFSFPLVVLVSTGVVPFYGAHHCHNLEAWFAHASGIKVVMPSSAAEAKGLLKSAIRDDNPVIFFHDIPLEHVPGQIPEGEHLIPIGKAAVVREGQSATVITYGRLVQTALEAAATLAEQGVSVEVIDLRTIKPLDEEAVLASVRKTGRLVVVHEASGTCGVGAELAAIVAGKAFSALKGPILRLTGPDTPVPASPPLANMFAPQAPQIIQAVQQLVG